jgi:endoglucanase
MKKDMLLSGVFIVFILLSCHVNEDKRLEELPVRLNSIGFLPDKQKRATIASPCSTFTVCRAADDTAVYGGTVTGPFASDDTGETVYIADFSDVTETGAFYLSVDGVGKSTQFSISETIYNDVFKTLMLGMYLWRSGTAVSARYDGVRYSHAASHMNDAYLYYITGEHTIKDGKRGWYDAGDFGKYVANAGITLGMMFKAWEHFQTAIETVGIEVPESGGTYPDYLDEIKWEMDWILTMQYPDESGRVSHKLTARNFASFIMPEQDTSLRYFVPWSSAATADFVAVCAIASRVCAPYDAAFAQKCRDAAEKSHAFLDDNPDNHYADQSDFSTGGYVSDDADDRLWAASELWETTGTAEYRDDFETRASAYSDKIQTIFDWGDVRNMGMITYLMSEKTGKNPSIENDIHADLLSAADSIVGTGDANPYGRPMGGMYYWGCNGTVARQTLLLRVAYMLTGNETYIDTALDAIGHLFGRNYYSRSYVTGLGYFPPEFPHDRRSGADTIADPWPGYLVGGGHTATGWVDVEESYETNEIAINWNSALIYAVAGFLDQSL